jgi:hypothetical protein
MIICKVRYLFINYYNLCKKKYTLLFYSYNIIKITNSYNCMLFGLYYSNWIVIHSMKNVQISISNFRRVLYVVRFLLGNSPASEFYMSTFRNTLSVPSLFIYHLPAYENGTDSVFRNVGI